MGTTKKDENRYASETQLILAKLYQYVTVIGLVFMAAAFILYTSAILPAEVPAADVRSYWHLDSDAYTAQTGTPVGWDFIKNLSSGDSLSFGSLAFMAVAIIVCMTIMIFVFVRKKNLLFACIALIQTTVLLLAASGIISGQ